MPLASSSRPTPSTTGLRQTLSRSRGMYIRANGFPTAGAVTGWGAAVVAAGTAVALGSGAAVTLGCGVATMAGGDHEETSSSRVDSAALAACTFVHHSW